MSGVVEWLDGVADAFAAAAVAKSLVAHAALIELQRSLNEHRREQRVNKIDEALRVANSYASSASTVALQAAWVRDVKDARIKQLEDDHEQLLHKLGRVKAERDQVKVRLQAVDAKERRFGDPTKLALELSRLQNEHSATKKEMALHREHQRKPVCAEGSTQTLGTAPLLAYAGDRAGYSLLLIEESSQRRGIQLACQDALVDLIQEKNAVAVNAATGSTRQLRTSLSHASIENQMLHEELSLCLRRIAKLEAHSPDAHIGTSARSAMALDTKETQTVASDISEETFHVLQTENAKLKLLLTKFVGVVATRIIVPGCA